MKGIEYAILRQGVGVRDLNAQECGAWYYCVLVKHPTVGYFLYDAGVGPGDDTFRRPESHMQYGMLSIPREEYLDKALPALGVSLDEIRAIIVSHCHWDHFGGLCFFKGTEAIKNVYVCEPDFKYGLFQSHRTAKGYMEPCDFYYRWNFDVEGADFHMISEDTEIFPDVELKIFRGHTPGCMSMILRRENDTVIFTSDTVPRRENYDDPIGHIHFTCTDVEAFRSAVKELHALEEKYHATMMFPHDDRPIRGYKPVFVK